VEISSTTASIRFLRRAPSTTFAPCRARSFAVLSPMPLLAPVITTTLSVIFDVSIFCFSLLISTFCSPQGFVQKVCNPTHGSGCVKPRVNRRFFVRGSSCDFVDRLLRPREKRSTKSHELTLTTTPNLGSSRLGGVA